VEGKKRGKRLASLRLRLFYDVKGDFFSFPLASWAKERG